jgi:hypothetical protein
MVAACECCVLSGGGLCVGLITLPEESYRVWVSECDRESLEVGGNDPKTGRKSVRLAFLLSVRTEQLGSL